MSWTVTLLDGHELSPKMWSLYALGEGGTDGATDDGGETHDEPLDCGGRLGGSSLESDETVGALCSASKARGDSAGPKRKALTATRTALPVLTCVWEAGEASLGATGSSTGLIACKGCVS